MSIGKQKGVAAIEFTIMLPILLLMVLATAEIGRAIYQYSYLTRMVRDASRYLSVTAIPDTEGSLAASFDNNCDLGDDCNLDCNNCISETKDLLVYGKVGGAVPLLYGLSTSDVIISGSPATNIVVVSVDYNWQPLFGDRISGFGIGDGIDLSFNFNVSHAMRAGL